MHSNKTFVLSSDNEILTKNFWWATAIRLNQLGLSRLKTIEFYDEALFHRLDRLVLSYDGKLFELDEDIIDRAFSYDDSFRWISDTKHRVVDPPSRNPNRKNLLRFQLSEIVFQIIDKPITDVFKHAFV